MMRRYVKNLLFALQKKIVVVAYLVGRNSGVKASDGCVIGVEEIASMLKNVSDSIPDAVTVNLYKNKYYDFSYDFEVDGYKFLRFIISPWLLGRLLRRYDKFIYVGAHGFLIDEIDGREFEFSFVRAAGAKVVCIFTGSDIRSVDLLDCYGKKNKLDVITTYQAYSCPENHTPEKEKQRKRLAEVADKHADLVFSPSVDQASYMKKDSLPFLYFYPDNYISSNPKKWRDVHRLRVVHAPSSPIIKGTQLVRAAVKKLQEEGYDFDYIEMLDMPHKEVLSCLDRAHIVLNEFYAFVPGVFGVEAMAANTVLLTSATRDREPTLFEGADQAWVVTPYWRVYDNLKEQLERPVDSLQQQADQGSLWVKRYCSYSHSSQYMRQALASLGD